ncbi:DUF2982 domain-containing protein [Algicola sagamiensis]|uniref:DUF2982 domain-containing protein n=1 Tax=Algicola sagamiensis TaxID=163869 RepID=UPI00037260EF|nr:DUF2982 domain-containing protein [Algicola sagamiensis]
MENKAQIQPTAVRIRGQASRGGSLLILMSAGLFGLTTLLRLIDVPFVADIYLFITLICIALSAFGFLKLNEPRYSITMNDKGFCYHHRLGKWRIDWVELMHIGVPEVASGFETQTLSFIGIRIRDPALLVQQPSLRFLVKVMTEQRPLLIQAAKALEIPTHELEDFFFEPPSFVYEGNKYAGVIGQFLCRCDKLRAAFGFDLYIPVSALDKEGLQFCKEVRQLKLQWLAYLEQTN